MKFSTGKTARAVRRREIIADLLETIENLTGLLNDKIKATEVKNTARRVSMELSEICAIDANQNTRPRKRT